MPSVLVVDDEPAALAAIADALDAHSYLVSTAEDGEQALLAIAADRPDLVVLDVVLPRLDGLGVCRALRAAGDRTPTTTWSSRSTSAS